jgi:hypothetical protein
MPCCAVPWLPATRSSPCNTLSSRAKQTVDHMHKGRSPTTVMYTPYLRIHEHVHACVPTVTRHLQSVKPPLPPYQRLQPYHHTRHCLQWQPMGLPASCGTAQLWKPASLRLSSQTRSQVTSLQRLQRQAAAQKAQCLPLATSTRQGLQISHNPACLATVPVAAGHTLAAMHLHLIAPPFQPPRWLQPGWAQGQCLSPEGLCKSNTTCKQLVSEHDCVDACILVTACQMLRAGGKQRNQNIPPHQTEGSQTTQSTWQRPELRAAAHNPVITPNSRRGINHAVQSRWTQRPLGTGSVEAAGFIHRSRPLTPLQPCHPRSLVIRHASTILYASNRTHRHVATSTAAATARKDQQTTPHAMLLPVAQPAPGALGACHHLQQHSQLRPSRKSCKPPAPTAQQRGCRWQRMPLVPAVCSVR